MSEDIRHIKEENNRMEIQARNTQKLEHELKNIIVRE